MRFGRIATKIALWDIRAEKNYYYTAIRSTIKCEMCYPNV